MLAVAILAGLATVTVLDLPPGAVARLGDVRFRAGGPIRFLAATTDGRTLAAWFDAPEPGRLFSVAWNLDTGRQVAGPDCPPPGPCRSARAGAGRVLIAGPGPVALLWDTIGERPVARFAAHVAPVRAVAVAPDGTWFATGDAAGVVRLWDATTLTPRFRTTGHAAAVRSIRFSGDGRRAVTTADDRTARVWDVGTGRELRAFPSRGPAELTADGLAVVLVEPGGAIIVRDVLTGLATLPARSPNRPIPTVTELMARLGVCLAASPDGRTLALPLPDGSIGLVERLTGGLRTTLPGHGTPCRLAAFSPDGTRLLTAGDDHTVLVWDVRPQAVRLPERLRRETDAAKLWATMVSGPADEAFLAMARLAAEPDAAVQTARLRIRPATSDDPDTPAQRVADSRAVELLEALGTSDARHVLERLVEDGDRTAWRTREAIRALIRLKHAAGYRDGPTPSRP